MTEPLFDGYDPPPAPALDTRGKDAKRAANQKSLLAAGLHPATRKRLRPGDDTCGDCAHLYVKDRYPSRWFKCDVTPFAYDMRKGWPACHLFRSREESETEASRG